MEISNLSTRLILSVEQAKSTALASLRPGTQLQARVLAPTSQNRAVLEIDGQPLRVDTKMELNTGQQLRLQVARAANPIELVLLPEGRGDTPQAHALRQALPRQVPLARGLTELQRLVNELAAAGNSKPQAPPTSAATYPAPPLPATTPPPQGADKPLQPLVPGALPERPAAQTVTTGQSAPVAPSDAPRPPQSPLQPLIDQLRQLLPAAKATELVATMERVLARGAAATPPDPSRLQQQISQSGLFLEARLAAGQHPTADLKADLLQLLFLLRPLLPQQAPVKEPPGAPVPSGENPQPSSPSPLLVRLLQELFGQAEGSLARILVNQLASLPASETPQQAWHFELPLRFGESHQSVQIRIERERPPGQEGTADSWSVNLDFDLEPLGPVNSRLLLQNDQITSHFTAQRAESAAKLQQALPRLEQALTLAGLKVGGLSASQGQTTPTAAMPTTPPYPLLDEKA